MRDDLKFLYKKAMRSKDIEFLEEVFNLLLFADMFREAERISLRSANIQGYYPDGKFAFLVEELMGKSWYGGRVICDAGRDGQ